ncbi:hypothetical protein L1987_58808 [Smallanthus sonchifolius]|uniref:Uncharacterized protein n=1 Tax=Smallanthus sonchifolius TaxID=185202 RepID=A0ACB9D3U0_9ASTR|nr:hypothetical protein L1987_58808 [Smallanthus sonchifolius]
MGVVSFIVLFSTMWQFDSLLETMSKDSGTRPAYLFTLRYPTREPGRAEADFGRLDAKTVVRNIYILFSGYELPIATENQEIMDIVDPSTPLPPWFTEEDLSAYGTLYQKSGFLNSLKVPYRSIEEEYDIEDHVIKNPMLLIVGEKDYFLKFPGVEDLIKSGTVKHFASDLEIEYVPEGSHFVQEQFPDKVNPMIIAFLRKHC